MFLQYVLCFNMFLQYDLYFICHFRPNLSSTLHLNICQYCFISLLRRFNHGNIAAEVSPKSGLCRSHTRMHTPGILKMQLGLQVDYMLSVHIQKAYKNKYYNCVVSD